MQTKRMVILIIIMNHIIMIIIIIIKSVNGMDGRKKGEEVMDAREMSVLGSEEERGDGELPGVLRELGVGRRGGGVGGVV